MAKKQFIALSNVTLGKGEYEMVSREKTKFALIKKGEIFKAEEASVEKLIKLGKIKETNATVAAVDESAVAEEAPADKRTWRRGGK